MLTLKKLCQFRSDVILWKPALKRCLSRRVISPN